MVSFSNDHPSSYDDDKVQTELLGSFDTSNCAIVVPFIGHQISVYLPLKHQSFSGTFNVIKDDGKHVVLHDDDDIETLNFGCEKLQFVENDAIRASEAGLKDTLERNVQ